VGRTLAILDPLPDIRNVGIAYRHAGVFYRQVGERIESKDAPGGASAGTSPESWYRKSLDALLRSERIELAQDESARLENAKRGKPGLTFVPGALYLQLGRTYKRLSDNEHALAAFERGRLLESDPDILEEAGLAYSAAGDPRKAALALVEAIAVDPGRTRLSTKLIELYKEIDPNGCAVAGQGSRQSLNLSCPLVHNDICAASRNVMETYQRRGQNSDAAAIRKTAVQELGCVI
jgi:tetratricopeptide (TPR) repeat protein